MTFKIRVDLTFKTELSTVRHQCLWVSMHSGVAPAVFSLRPRLEKMVAEQHEKVVMTKVDINDHTL